MDRKELSERFNRGEKDFSGIDWKDIMELSASSAIAIALRLTVDYRTYQ